MADFMGHRIVWSLRDTKERVWRTTKEQLGDIIREIRCGDSDVCKECNVVGKGRPLLFEPVEEKPAIMLISQAPGNPEKTGYASVHEWLYRVSFIPSLFDKAHKKFGLAQDWKCTPAYWTHLEVLSGGSKRRPHSASQGLCERVPSDRT